MPRAAALLCALALAPARAAWDVSHDALAAVPARAAPRWGPNPGVFASHMVLASSDPWSGGVTPARVWGTAAPGEAVAVGGLPAGAVVRPSNPVVADAAGNWSITIAQRASLTPYALSFKSTTVAANAVVLEDVLFGHTFLCSGQR